MGKHAALIGKLIGILVTLGVLALVVAWLAGVFHETIPPGHTPPPERKLGDRATVTVTARRTPVVVEALGSLRARVRTTVAPEIPGRIDAITVRSGDRVKAGDVLIRLAVEDQQRRVRQAEEAQQAATARLDEARRDFERTQRLFAEGATTQAAFDAAGARLATLEAETRRAAEAVAEAQVVLSYATIRAPRSGQIVDRLVQPGDVVQAGTPLLVMYDPGTLRLESPVPEQLAVRLKRGAQLPVRIDALGRRFEATIDEIVPQADVASRSFLVKAVLPTDPVLFEGMFGRLLIETDEREVLCLPRRAVQSIGQLDFVEVVTEREILERRFVKLGSPALCPAEHVEVLSGIAAGTTVALPEAAAKQSSAS
jgi:RND family efflux transporter MFP subunit